MSKLHVYVISSLTKYYSRKIRFLNNFYFFLFNLYRWTRDLHAQSIFLFIISRCRIGIDNFYPPSSDEAHISKNCARGRRHRRLRNTFNAARVPTNPPPTRAITRIMCIRFPHSPNYKSVFFLHLKFTNHITYPHNHCSVVNNNVYTYKFTGPRKGVLRSKPTAVVDTDINFWRGYKNVKL